MRSSDGHGHDSGDARPPRGAGRRRETRAGASPALLPEGEREPVRATNGTVSRTPPGGEPA